MHHRPTFNNQNYGRKHKRKPMWLGVRHTVLGYNTKSTFHKRKKKKISDFFKIYKNYLWKTSLGKWTETSIDMRTIYVWQRILQLEYTKNSEN